MRYAIIRQSTDSRCPMSEVEFTRSKKVISAALVEKPKLTYNDPEAAKNWHHTLTYVYELPDGWRRPSQKFLSERVSKCSSCYPRTKTDILADKIMDDGVRVIDF